MRAITLLRAAGLLVFGRILILPAAAAVWVDPNWALIGEVRPVVTYDSNLTAQRDGPDDWYLTVTPKLLLSRRGSATRLDIDAQVERSWFQDFDTYNSTDPAVNVLYEFPTGPDDEPTSHVDLHWGRNSSTNTDLGRRVRSENLRGRWDQQVFDTGRTRVDVRVAADSTDYREDDLNTNKAVSLETRAGYAVTPQVRVGLGYGHQWMRSQGAPALDRGDTKGDEDRVVARATGELLPKLTGSVETGVAFVRYHGAVQRDDTAWIAAVSLHWQPAPETDATISASRYTDFSPEGGTALRSECFLDLTRQISRGFSLRAGGGLARVQTFFNDAQNHANAVILRAGLAYELTERFSAELSDRWTRQRADRDAFDYERHLVSGQFNVRF